MRTSTVRVRDLGVGLRLVHIFIYMFLIVVVEDIVIDYLVDIRKAFRVRK